MEIKIEKGQNIIDILCDGFVTCLKIRKPIAVHWENWACGTSGRYFSFIEDYEPLVKNFDETLIYGSYDEIIDIISEFLNLFTSGSYCVSIIKLQNSNDCTIHFDYTRQNNSFNFFYGYYEPSGHNMLFTQNYNNINQNRVKEYENLILSGIRPKAVLFEASFGDIFSPMFILDGHHKLLAYNNLKVKPEFVMIEKIGTVKNEILKKDKLFFFEYEYFLNNFSKQHIISWNPIILTDNKEEVINYNTIFDEYLANTTRIETPVLKKFQEAQKSEDSKLLNWLDNKLYIIENRDFKKIKLMLNYPISKYSWGIMEIKSKLDFFEWKTRLFGNEFEM